MRVLPDIEKKRVLTGKMGSDSSYGCNGVFIMRRHRVEIHVVISDGGGWDHVSVSCERRCPTWEEMCWIKNLFFHPEETVVEYHPAKSNYINYHPFCLHLWKPQGADLLMPPEWMVGPSNEGEKHEPT